MRFDSLEFRAKNLATSREPIFVVELSFDLLNTDTYFFTTGAVAGLTGNISNGVLKVVSSTSQKLDIYNAHSTIGTIDFEVLDSGLTALMRQRLESGLGLKGKRVRVYQGYTGLLWDSFVLIQTQIIDRDIEYKDRVYKFRCSDIQREMRKSIFIPKETTLVQNALYEHEEITVSSTVGFQMVYQVPSAKNKTVLRRLQAETSEGSPKYPQLVGVDRVGFLRVEHDGDVEIMMYTGMTSTRFTGIVRGVLGSKRLDIEISDGSEGPKVTEYIYMEMPGLKAAYALLTGSLYGNPGEFLPDHWHLGISTDYIATSTFTSSRPDLWNLNNDDDGFPVVIQQKEKVEGKKFIQQEIFYMLGVYTTVLNDGQLSLKSLGNVSSTAGTVRDLNENNITQITNYRHALHQVLNTFILRWGWDESREVYTRTSVFQDSESIQRHGASDPKEVELTTLGVTRHTDKMIRHHFGSQRSRFAGPPILLDLELTPDQNDLEVGDLVSVEIDLEDFTNESGTIDRTFEVQAIKNDWVKGKVKVSLFGSSDNASQDTGFGAETDSLDLGFISSQGTEISAANFPGAGINSDGFVTTVTGTLNLTGHDNLNNSSCIYYCTEDLEFTGSSIVNIDKNVQIRCAGYISCYGLINGEGAGHAGGQPTPQGTPLLMMQQSSAWVYPLVNEHGIGGLGSSRSQGGIVYWGLFNDYLRPLEQELTVQGVHATLDDFTPLLSVEDGFLKGLPESLSGSSGPAGGPGVQGARELDEIDSEFSSAWVEHPGGAGGAGGAGLVLIARGGTLGTGGIINLSGEDGGVGEDCRNLESGAIVARSGAGGGGYPGGFLFVNIDSSQSFPNLTNTNCIQERGVCPVNGVPLLGKQKWNPGNVYTNGLYTGTARARQNTYLDNAKIIALDISNTTSENENPYVRTNPTFTLAEVLNTPVSPNGDRSTVEVSVTPPADTNYSYSRVFYREQGTNRGWTEGNPASHEGSFVVPSDGRSYEVRVSAVSLSGNMSTGLTQSITVTNVAGSTDSELALIYPFSTITGLRLQEGNGNIFSTRDVSFEWSSNNSELIYFNFYEITLYNLGTLIRTEKSTAPSYVYSYEKNALDYYTHNNEQGVYDELTVHVRPISRYYNNTNELYGGISTSITVEAEPVLPPDVTVSFVGENAILSWPPTNSDFRVLTTTLKYQGETLFHTDGNRIVMPVDWIGSRSFDFTVSHRAARESASSTITINPTRPASAVVTTQTIANTIMFYYRSEVGSLPIDRYEIRKSDTYNGSLEPDIKAGNSSFTIYQELSGGTKIYWFEAVDTAGNRSDPVSVSVQVSQPTNYQLLTRYSEKEAGWPGARTDCLVTNNNNLLLPVNVTDTWLDHFVNNGWLTPQDQIDANFEYFIQPSTNTAQYVVNFDLGAVISSSIISATTAPVVLDGSVTSDIQIEYSLDNSNWIAAPAGQSQTLGINFQYVRVTVDFDASGGDDLAIVEDILIKLDKQLEQDSGKFTANASDVNGTRVYFNKNFIDAQTPVVSLSSSTIIDPVVYFEDVPDPEYFDVYAFDRNTGQRVTVNGSWQVNGFTRVEI